MKISKGMKKSILIFLSFPITLVVYILLFSGNIQYSEEIVINANIDVVSDLFDNPYNMLEYMDGIEKYELMSGEIREVGAKAEITAIVGESKIIMLEEVIINNLPEEKKVIYEADRVYNIVSTKLIRISEKQTKLINDQEFKFRGYMKIMAFFMSSAFEHQSRVYLDSFKEFVENQ